MLTRCQGTQPSATGGAGFRRLFSATLALVAVTIVHGICLAQGAPMVDPPSVVLRADAGEAFVGSLRVSNASDESLSLRAYLSDWWFDVEGQLRFGEVGTTAGSAGAWISLATPVVELDARGSTQVRYDVSVPPGTEPGTYWSVVFLHSEPGDPAPGQAVAAQSVRVGHVVYVEIPPLTKDAAIRAVFGERPPAHGDPYILRVQYANTGNSVQRVTQRVSVRDDRGETVIDAMFEPLVVLPATERLLSIRLFGPLAAGAFTAVVVIDFGDDEVEVAATHDFVLPDGLAGAPR